MMRTFDNPIEATPVMIRDPNLWTHVFLPIKTADCHKKPGFEGLGVVLDYFEETDEAVVILGANIFLLDVPSTAPPVLELNPRRMKVDELIAAGWMVD